MKKFLAFCLTVMTMISFAMPIQAAADDSVFVPSIERKDAPEIQSETIVDENGNYINIVATIVVGSDGSGWSVVDNLDDLSLILTPLREAYEKKDEATSTLKSMIYENLIDAHMQIEITNLSGLWEELGIKEELDAAAKEKYEASETYQDIYREFDSSVFEISDIFDVTINEAFERYLEADDHYLRVTFTITGDASDIIVIHKSTKYGWLVVEDDCIEVDGDKLTVCFSSLCPIAFLRVAEDKAVVKCCNFCPDWCPFCQFLCLTNGTCLCWIVPVIILLVIIFVVLVIVLSVKKRKEDAPEDEPEDENQNE